MKRLAFCLAAIAAATPAITPAATLAPMPAIPAVNGYVGVHHADWVKDAAIYELSLRQFTAEGTIAAAERHLPRLKALGVGILWLMPIHPSGKLRPAGPLGSPYAVQDFRAVDPAYGTLDDLRRFVAAAHHLGMHVILDWVGNHSAWDNALVAAHPDWYEHSADGALASPAWFGWNDTVAFDYRASGLRRYMADAMAYWVRAADVDGFRCDAAGLVPLEFWEQTRIELDRIKPVFLLAEWESRDLSFRAFDMQYGWSWTKGLDAVASGHADLGELRAYYAWDGRFWPANAIRMLYVSNHDVIGGGTEFERYGPALDAAIALSVTSESMPLIFNGQEAGNRRRLNMFVKNPIEWRDDPEGALYQRLLAVRRSHPALWARPWGGRVREVNNDDHSHILSFSRTVPSDEVLAVFNMSGGRRTAHLDLGRLPGVWKDALGPATVTGGGLLSLEMPPWSYRLFVGDQEAK